MRLILTTSDSGAGGLRQTGLADIVIPFGFRFVWGPLPSDADLVTSLSRGSLQPDGTIDHFTMLPVSPLADFSFDYQDLLLRLAIAEKK